MIATQSVAGPGQLSFDFLPQCDVVVQRHDGQLTSDAGLLPVRQFDQRWRYTERMADCLGGTDARADPTHDVARMLRQRVYGILAGYEDCNVHDALRDEPVFKLVAGGVPPDGGPLASQPTLSRLQFRDVHRPQPQDMIQVANGVRHAQLDDKTTAASITRRVGP